MTYQLLVENDASLNNVSEIREEFQEGKYASLLDLFKLYTKFIDPHMCNDKEETV